MSEIHPDSGSQPAPAPSGAEREPRLSHVVPTTAIFAAALERLNRSSVLRVLQEVVREVDAHCRVFPELISEEAGKVRAELLAVVAALRERSEHHHNEFTLVSRHLHELHEQLTQVNLHFESNVTRVANHTLEVHLPAIITSVSTQINQSLEQHVTQLVNTTLQQHVTELSVVEEQRTASQRALESHQVEIQTIMTRVTELGSRLETLQEAMRELGPGELQQVEQLFVTLLSSAHLSRALNRAHVTIQGRAVPLERLLSVLTTADKVQAVHLSYGDLHISGARMVLSDSSEVTFTCDLQEHQERGELHYRFQTQDWKGLAASFSMLFARRRVPLQMCGHNLSLDSYDGMYQSNIIFDLG